MVIFHSYVNVSLPEGTSPLATQMLAIGNCLGPRGRYWSPRCPSTFQLQQLVGRGFKLWRPNVWSELSPKMRPGTSIHWCFCISFSTFIWPRKGMEAWNPNLCLSLPLICICKCLLPKCLLFTHLLPFSIRHSAPLRETNFPTKTSTSRTMKHNLQALLFSIPMSLSLVFLYCWNMLPCLLPSLWLSICTWSIPWTSHSESMQLAAATANNCTMNSNGIAAASTTLSACCC